MSDKSTNANITKDIVWKMENLTLTLDDLYDSIIQPPLPRLKVAPIREHKRPKRGLINIIGRINKWFTGVLDDEDEVKFTEEIESLKRDSNKWKAMALDNVQLLQDTLKEVKEKTKQFQQVQEAFQAEIKSIRSVFNQQKLNHVFEQFVLQYELIHSSLTTIQETILFAPIRVNPALIQPRKIYSLLSNITLPPQRRFPLNITDSHFSSFLSLCKLETHLRFSTVIFVLTIPILDMREYTIYETHISPVPQEQHYVIFITNAQKYFILDSTQSLYKVFNSPLYSSLGQPLLMHIS